MRAAVVFLVIVIGLAMGCTRSPEAKKARYLDRGDRYFTQQKYREATIEYRNALRIEENNPRATRQLALAHYQLGEMGQAFRYLLRAQQITPDDLEVRQKLGTIYLLGGKIDEARTQAEYILQKDSKNLEGLLLLAPTAKTASEIEAVIAKVQRVLDDFPGEATPLLILASLNLRKGDETTGERFLREAVAREPRSVEAHVALANLYLTRRQNGLAEHELRIAAELAPVGSPAQTKLADFYLLVGRRDDAKRVLADVVARAPDYLPAWRLLSEIALAEGKLDESTKANEMVLKKNPNDPEGRLLRGRLYLARRETPQAIQEFQAVLKTEPRLAPASYQLALAHLQTGNTEQAKVALAEALGTAPDFREATLLLAELNLRTGAVQPAIDDLERFVAKQPQLAAASVLLASAYLAQRKPDKALEVGRKLVAAAPRDPFGPYLVGLGLAAQDKRAEARRQFETALELAPASVEPLAQLAALHVSEHQPALAVERIKAQIVRAPQSAQHRVLLGDAYLAADDRKAAEAAFEQAIELDRRLVLPYVRLASLYAVAGRYDDALVKVNEAIKASPHDASPLVQAGIIYEQKGDLSGARQSYEKALAINPYLATAANNLAWIYSEHGGDQNKALAWAQRAKEVSPDDPRVSDTLGWILYKRGIYQRALALLAESAVKLPDNPQVQYHLGMVYVQTGDQAKARKALESAVNSIASFAGKDEAKKALASLK